MIIALLIGAAEVQFALDDPVETACYKHNQSQLGMNHCAGRTASNE